MFYGIFIVLALITSYQEVTSAGKKAEGKSSKDTICAQRPKPKADGIGYEPPTPWADKTTLEELAELLMLRVSLNPDTDGIANLPASTLIWPAQLITYFAAITKRTCQSRFVSDRFVTSTKNFFIYYIHKLNSHIEKNGSPEDKKRWSAHRSSWTDIIDSVRKCYDNLKPIYFDANYSSAADCRVMDRFRGRDGEMVEGRGSIVEEKMDKNVTEKQAIAEPIIDAAWWMFSVSFARCYGYFYPDEFLVNQMGKRFREDVMYFFSKKWMSVEKTDVTKFATILGHFQFKNGILNLRKCATLSHDYERIAQRILVRPGVVNNTKEADFGGKNPKGARIETQTGGPSIPTPFSFYDDWP